MATDCLQKREIKLVKPFKDSEGRWVNKIAVPCGQCARCYQRRKAEWGFRMQYEAYRSKCAYFVTLTYAPEHLPYDKYGNKVLVETRADDLRFWMQEKGRTRLTKKFKKEHHDRSLQGFFKRLRRYEETNNQVTWENYFNNLTKKDKIKYYACGEYGEEKGRPHYHAIIYNASVINILKAWPYGDVMAVKSTDHTIGYVMKYLDKRLTEQKKIWHKPREFNTMSEGIGDEYISKYKTWHKRNLDILYCTTMTGHLIPMPRYYRNAIFDEHERIQQVQIVNEKLHQVKLDMIDDAGIEEYNRFMNLTLKGSEKRFRKKMKKRIVD